MATPVEHASEQLREIETKLAQKRMRPKAWWLPVFFGALAVIFGTATITIFLMQTMFAPVAPPPLTFPDLPNPIEGPQGVPLPRDGPLPQFHAGDVVVTDPYRCVTDDGGTNLGELSYVFTRGLYDSQTHQRVIDMPGGENSAAVGCHRTHSTLQYIPQNAKPGTYYLGGEATATGLHRAATVAWRTADFEVIP
jgi:hypothetical protein